MHFKERVASWHYYYHKANKYLRDGNYEKASTNGHNCLNIIKSSFNPDSESSIEKFIEYYDKTMSTMRKCARVRAFDSGHKKCHSNCRCEENNLLKVMDVYTILLKKCPHLSNETQLKINKKIIKTKIELEQFYTERKLGLEKTQFRIRFRANSLKLISTKEER